MYINGNWITSDKSVEIKNPGTGEIFTTVPKVGEKETRMAIKAAKEAFNDWSSKPAKERAEFLERVADAMKQKREKLAQTISNEMGKPIKNARGEVDKSIEFIKWFAEEAKRVYGETIPASQNYKRLTVIKQPVGVVAAITPWNFPLSMIARKLAPALAAGCTFVLRPSTQAPVSAVELFRILEECEMPTGVVNLVIGNADEISNTLLYSKDIRKITFTGSTKVGKQLMAKASDSVKKVSMELGGHAPFIVFPDADLELAVESAVTIKFSAAGQQCVCANRIYIHKDIYHEFEKLFVEKVKKLQVGNSHDEHVAVGPLINEGAIENIQNQVDNAVNNGAKVLYGGYRLTDSFYNKGTFYCPTVLSDITDDMKIVHEETFGPVAPLIPFENEDEVIEKANNTEYGLAAYFFTNDNSRIYRVSEKLEYGIVGVNDAPASAVQAPFGGMKESGIGIEGGHGIDEYLESKLISVRIKV